MGHRVILPGGSGPQYEVRLLRLLEAGHLGEVAKELRANELLKRSPLTEALAVALEREGTVRTVARLAVETGIDRRRLAEHWRRIVVQEHLHLADFLRLLHLRRGVVIFSRVHSWSQVAVELGVHIRTLRRAADDLAKVPLREIRGHLPCEVVNLLGRPIVHLLNSASNAEHPLSPSTLLPLASRVRLRGQRSRVGSRMPFPRE